MGNATLKPELAKQHNAGISYDLPFTVQGGTKHASHFAIGVDGYYNKVENKIVAYPKGQQFRWTMLNLGMVDIRGVDAHADVDLALPQDFRLATKLQYTWQKAIDITNPDDTYYRHQIPYIPWHSGSVAVIFGWREYALNYSFIYVGERYSQQENTVYNHVQPWYTHDLSVTGRWQVRRVELHACLEINNLLGQDYEVILNYPMPKQNFRCTFGIAY